MIEFALNVLPVSDIVKGVPAEIGPADSFVHEPNVTVEFPNDETGIDIEYAPFLYND
jgi:hypothetical protein